MLAQNCLLTPCPTNIVVLFVNTYIQVLHLLFCLLQKIDSGSTCAHQDHTQFTLRPVRFFAYAIAIAVRFRDEMAITLGCSSIVFNVMNIIASVDASGIVVFDTHRFGVEKRLNPGYLSSLIKIISKSKRQGTNQNKSANSPSFWATQRLYERYMYLATPTCGDNRGGQAEDIKARALEMPRWRRLTTIQQKLPRSPSVHLCNAT